MNNNPQDKYDKISTLLAKVVLYSQLCSERAENGGQPGELEKLLGEGNSKIIKDNIQNTAIRLAKDPVFQNLFLEKAGGMEGKVLCPNTTKFEKMAASGGCDRFRLEYMQKLKDMANEKEQQAVSNEMQMANQKQQDAPKAMV